MTASVLAGSVNMGPDEKLNLAISFANRLSGTEAITGVATVTLLDETSGRTYSDGLSGSAIVASPSVVQMVYRLKSGHKYLLNMSVGTTLDQILQGEIAITCEGKPHLL